jgi:hypothetical protein
MLTLRRLLLIAALGSLGTTGCQTPQQWLESMKGDGFSEWNEGVGSGFRGDSSKAKPSGFFTDRRSEQIEQSLGGGF